MSAWLVLALTAPYIPIVWDEAEYLLRADRVIAWFALLFDPTNPHGGLHALSKPVIDEHWPYVTHFEGHPAWSAVVIALGKGLLAGKLDPLTAARFGPITLFAVAAGATSFRLCEQYGVVAALMAPVALLTLPRLFADAHFAALDGQLTAWWLLVWAADSSRRRGTATAVAVGMLAGLSCATKFTGWFVFVPIVGWRVLRRDAAAMRELFIIVPVAVAAFIAFSPPLWHAPIGGFATHVRLNFGRRDTRLLGTGSADSPVVSVHDYLMGPMGYGAAHPYLPWYNTIVWLAIATPLPTLVLGAIGLRSSRSPALVLHWAVLMVVRALPGAPPYDGIRLFLPAFAFWCVLAAVGAQRLWHTGHIHFGRVAITIAFAAAAVNLSRYFPQALSHYSALVGGVRGASALGFEPTYWWDALDGDVLGWLNSHTAANEAVAFSESHPYGVALLQGWHRLQTKVADPGERRVRWYVLQNRPSLLTDIDRELMASFAPAYTKYPGHHGDRVPADLRAPLILVFSGAQYDEAARRTGGPM